MLPTSATIAAKAAGYLTAGRVTVVQADDTTGVFVAAVHGTAAYTVWRGRTGGSWHCTCPAGSFGRRCAHVTAVALLAGDHR
jgi:uncharacterized Zn finger protein